MQVAHHHALLVAWMKGRAFIVLARICHFSIPTYSQDVIVIFIFFAVLEDILHS